MMNMHSHSPRPERGGPGFLGALLGIAIAVVGFSLMVGALMLGVVAAIGALLWSLVRGARPAPVRFEWRQTTARAWAPAARRPAHGRVIDGEVIEAEVREIPDKRPR